MRKKQVMAMALSAAMAAGVLGGTGIMAAAEDTVTLTFPVWDLASTPYIQDVVDGFEAENRTSKSISWTLRRQII